MLFQFPNSGWIDGQSITQAWHMGNALFTTGLPVGDVVPYGKYWNYKTVPTVLVGGSSDNNMFNNDLTTMYAELDALQAIGGNYIRLTLSGVDYKAYQIASGETTLYDLNVFNQTFFDRISDFVNECALRDIVVQIDLWEKFLYFNPGGAWDADPFNPANNVNYTEANTTLTITQERDNTVPVVEIKFMATVPNLNNDTVVLPYQIAYINKMMDTLLPYDNVLYNIGNEDSCDVEWNYYWADHIQSRALLAGKQIFISSMRDVYDYTGTQVTVATDVASGTHFNFFEASQFTHANAGADALWTEYTSLRNAIANHPINLEKIYGGTAETHGTVAQGILHFYISYLFGVSALRLHRQPEGMGSTALGYQQIKLLKDIEVITSAVNRITDIGHSKIVSRTADTSYLSYEAGSAYVLFVNGSGSTTIDMSAETGTWACRWANIDDGSIYVVTNETSGGNVTITPPASNVYGWVAILTSGALTVDYPTVTNYIVFDEVANNTNNWTYRTGSFEVIGTQFKIVTSGGYGGILNEALAVPATATTMKLTFTCEQIGTTTATPFVVVKDSSGVDIVSQQPGLGTNSITFGKPTSDTTVQVFLLLKTAARAYYYNLKLEEA